MKGKQYNKHRQGDLYWYDFGPEELEGVQGGMHPCLIISNDLFNRYASVVNILAVSSQKKKSPVHVLVPGCLKDQDNYVYCEQWVTASKSNLQEYIGHIDGDILGVVIERLVYHITHRSQIKGKWIGG